MKQILAVLILAAGVAGVTAGAGLLVDRGPFDRTPAGREAYAWGLALGGPSTEGQASLPGDPFIRGLRLLVGEELGAVRTARRTLLGVFLPLLAGLTTLLAWRRTGPGPAVLAGIAIGFTAPVVLTASSFTPATLAAIPALVALVVLDRTRSVGGWVGAGLLVAGTTALLPALGWSLGVLLGIVALVHPRSAPRLHAVGALGGAFLLGSLAWGLALDTGSMIPRVSGVDMARGHRSGATGVSPRRSAGDPDRWWAYREYWREASIRKDRPLTASQTETYWAVRAVREAASHPRQELVRAGRKLLTTYQGDPLPRDVGTAFLRTHTEGPGLAVWVWLGRLLLPLGAAGILLQLRRAGWMVAAGALSGFLAAGLTFADPDTRLVTLVSLGVGLALWVAVLQDGSTGKRILALVGGGAAIAVWGLWPPLGGVPGLEIRGDDHYHLGAVYDQEQRGSAALREYDRARRMEPENPYPRLAVAWMLARDQVYDEAIREMELLETIHPEFGTGLRTLCRLYEQRGRWKEAAALYGRLIDLEPWNAEYWNNLGTVYVQIGFYDQAARALERALALDPGYETARDNLVQLQERGLAPGGPVTGDSLRAAQEEIILLVRGEEFERAESTLVATYERMGRVSELVNMEGVLRLGQSTVAEREGHVEVSRSRAAEAVTLFESIQEEMSGSPIFLNNLGTAYSCGGDLEAARRAYEEALRLQPQNEHIRRNLQGVLDQLDSLRTDPEGGAPR